MATKVRIAIAHDVPSRGKTAVALKADARGGPSPSPDGRSLAPAQLVTLQRTAGNQAVARLLGARSITRPVTRTPRAVLQRDVGFEFQTGWGVRERGPYRQYRRQEVIVD